MTAIAPFEFRFPPFAPVPRSDAHECLLSTHCGHKRGPALTLVTMEVDVDAAEFRAAWDMSGAQLYQYPADSISARSLPQDTKHFLMAAGLPREAAPFLSFAPTTLNWLSQPGDDLDRFYALGSDGSGDPIAVDEDGVVWLIDHERPRRRTLVNSSVGALAECLLAYRKLVLETVIIGGDDAFFDGRVPLQLIENFSRSIDAVDRAAAGPGSYWGHELSRLMAEGTA